MDIILRPTSLEHAFKPSYRTISIVLVTILTDLKIDLAHGAPDIMHFALYEDPRGASLILDPSNFI